MKQIILACAFLGFFTLSFSHCKNNSSQDKAQMEKRDTTGPEYTSRYICPMYCKGSGSDAAGVCPVCGMDYVLNETYKEQDTPKTEDQKNEGQEEKTHNHDDHEGHDH
jgi:hypothetical protein